MRIPLSNPVTPASINGDRLQTGSPGMLSGPGEALQGLGQAISSVAASIKSNSDTMKNYNTKVELERWQTKENLRYSEDLNTSAPDGTDFVKKRETAMLESYKELRKTIKDPAQLAQADLIFEQTRNNHLVKGVGDAEKKQFGYVRDTTEASTRTAINIGQIKTDKEYQAWFDNNIKPRIMSTVKNPEDQRTLVDYFGKQMAKEFLSRNPQESLRWGDQSPTISGSKAKVPPGSGDSKTRAKQLEFVWHELNGAEKGAGTRLRNAQNLTQAVAAGASYERPQGYSHDAPHNTIAWNERLNNARKVLEGTATPEAMHARAYLESKGLTPVQASGMVGNLMAESGQHLNPGALNPGDGADGSHSVGIGQWNAERARAMLAFIGAENIGGEAGRDYQMPKGIRASGMSFNGPPVAVSSSMRPEGDLWNYLDGQDISSAQRAAKAELNAMQSEAKAAINTFQDDSLASLANTGKYTGPELGMADYQRAYGVEEGIKEYGKYIQSKNNALEISKFNTMTDEEIKTKLEAQKTSVPTGEGSDFAWGLYNESVKAANSVLEERAVKLSKEQQKSRPVFEARLGDIITAYQQTGGTNVKDEPVLSQFLALYPEDGEQRFKDFQYAKSVAREVNKLSGFTDDAIRDRIKEAYNKVPSGEGAEMAMKMAGTIQAAGNKIIAERAEIAAGAKAIQEAREKDPAGYAISQNPNIAQAWSNFDPENPEGAKAAIASTIEAQRQWGQPEDNIHPLPKAAAEKIVAVFNDERKNTETRMNSVLGMVQMTSDPSQQQKIYEQLVIAGLPPSVEASIDAHMRGDTGAARRLFMATLIKDKDKLPGELDVNEKAELNEAIKANMTEAGSAGSIYYGLEFADKADFDRASRDTALIEIVARTNMFDGKMTATQAVQAAIKDVMGEVEVLERPLPSGSVAALVPPGIDQDEFASGLNAVTLEVKAALEDTFKASIEQRFQDAKPEQLAVYKDAAAMHTKALMANGVFRNYQRGYAFFDPYTDKFVADASGKVISYSLEDILAFGAQRGPLPPNVIDGSRRPAK